MFRVITEFVPTPNLFLLCDHAHCGVYVCQPLEGTVNGNMNELSAAFVKIRQMEGWSVGLDQQVCPEHVKAGRALQQMIQVPKIVVPQ